MFSSSFHNQASTQRVDNAASTSTQRIEVDIALHRRINAMCLLGRISPGRVATPLKSCIGAAVY